MKTDQYKTIAGPSEALFKDKGSKFFAYARPTYSETAFQEFLGEVKKEHFKARHHCFAYKLGQSEDRYRINDDGEPSGTAGKPIYGQIKSFGLTNVAIIVVRYFGGTKLGVSGLINAYKTAAQMALKESTFIDKTIFKNIRIDFEYKWMGDLMAAVKKLSIEIRHQDLGIKGSLEIQLPLSIYEEKMWVIKSQLLKKSIEEAKIIDKIPGIQFEELN